MKRLAFAFFLALCLPLLAVAGNSITFVINDINTDNEEVIVYPEGTTYKVMDEEGQPLQPSQVEGGAKTFAPGNYQLFVYPSYRPEQADRIPIRSQQLRVFETPRDAKRSGYQKNWKEGKIVIHHDNGSQYISRPYGMEQVYEKGAELQKKIVVASEEKPGQYNLKLYFKNGLEFHYLDGKASARLNGEPQVIEGEYIVHTDIGSAKISFNPRNGETWWVFTKEEESKAE